MRSGGVGADDLEGGGVGVLGSDGVGTGDLEGGGVGVLGSDGVGTGDLKEVVAVFWDQVVSEKVIWD